MKIKFYPLSTSKKKLLSIDFYIKCYIKRTPHLCSLIQCKIECVHAKCPIPICLNINTLNKCSQLIDGFT